MLNHMLINHETGKCSSLCIHIGGKEVDSATAGLQSPRPHVSPSGGTCIAASAASTLLPSSSAAPENGPAVGPWPSSGAGGSEPGAGSAHSSASTERREGRCPSQVSGKARAAGARAWPASFLESFPPAGKEKVGGSSACFQSRGNPKP